MSPCLSSKRSRFAKVFSRFSSAVNSAVVILLGVWLIVALRVEHHSVIMKSWFSLLLLLVPLWIVIMRCRCDRVVSGDDQVKERKGTRWIIYLIVCLILFLFSSAMLHPWFYFLKWIPSGGEWLGRIHVFVFLLALCTSLSLGRVKHPAAWVMFFVIFWLCAAFYYFIRATGGHALLRDDHASMMFRLKEIALTYPQLLNYIPHWNAGVVHYTGAACGLNLITVIFWPFLRYFPVEDVYTPMIGVLYIFIVPFMAGLSLRLIGASWSAAGIAAILAAGVSRHFFLWLLNYGTVGACFASAMVLPVSACLYRVLWMNRTTWRMGLLLITASLLLLAWPPASLMAAALLTSVIVSWRQWSWRKVSFLLICGIGLVLLMWPQIRLLAFGEDSDFIKFMFKSARTTPDGGATGPVAELTTSAFFSQLFDHRGWGKLLAHLNEFHPALIFAGIVGVFALPYRSVRIWFLPPMIVLAFLTGWGPLIKPNLQLGRMAIPLAFMSVAPAALILDQIWRTKSVWLATFRSVVPVMIIITGWNLCSLWKGQGNAGYTVMGKNTFELAKFIQDNTPTNGRAMFAGRCVHFYGDHGHVAPLPLLAGREMMACDYYHFLPSVVEYQYPPSAFRHDPEKTWKFIDSYNVSLIITYHENWKKCLRAEPERYKEISMGVSNSIAAFIPQRVSSMFVKGDGEIKAQFNRLDIKLSVPCDDVVMKYAWAKGLVAKSPIEIYPYKVEEGYDLIGVKTHGESSFSIRFKDK